jgi:hypothetical protein
MGFSSSDAGVMEVQCSSGYIKRTTARQRLWSGNSRSKRVGCRTKVVRHTCKWERVCPPQRNGQVDGIQLLVPSVFWSFGPRGCISTGIVWLCIPCRLHPTKRSILYGVSTVENHCHEDSTNCLVWVETHNWVIGKDLFLTI